MQLRKSLFLKLFSIALLSSCSLFNNEKDIAKVSSLPTVRKYFTLSNTWSIFAGNNINNFYSNLHPAFSDNVIYVADRKGIVYAFNANDNKEVWSVNLAEKSSCFFRISALLAGGVTVARGRVYVGSEKAQVYALNANDGSIAWRTQVAGEVLSSPVVSDGIVLIHTSNGQFQALNETNGAVKWTVSLGTPFISLRGESAPAIAFDTAIIGDDNGYISAVLMQQGQIIWRQFISQINGATEIARLRDVDTTPVIVNNMVYALAYNGSLTALDLRSGQIVWRRELDTGSVNNFIVNGNHIYLIDQDDRVLALSTEGGVTLWSQSDLLHHVLTAPVLYNDVLVAGDRKGYIHWINPETGRLVAQKKVSNSGFLTKPVIANGQLLIQSKSNTLYAITF